MLLIYALHSLLLLGSAVHAKESVDKIEEIEKINQESLDI